MASASTNTSPHPSLFRDFDASVERMLGADMRLIYGMLVPILMVCGLIVALAFTPSPWLVGLIVLFELLGLTLVVYGFMVMMRDEDDDDEGLAR
jgi:protein-S-isoprenylcysteine O-methyltransferase Ste14